VNPADAVSPAEIAMDILTRLSWPGIAPAGVVVGPATDAQQQAGVIQCVAAGLPNLDKYGPVQWSRVQIRCLAPTLDLADRIAQNVYPVLNGRQRLTAYQASTGRRYLVHLVNVAAGPSQHYDSPETWEALVFAEMMIGTAPIPAS
jgi:hypothetical protein